MCRISCQPPCSCYCGDYILHEFWYGVYTFRRKTLYFSLRATPFVENIKFFSPCCTSYYNLPTCPAGGVLRHTTTDKDGKRTYRSTPKECVNCPCKAKCGANEKGQKVFTTHIWQKYPDLVEQIRKTERAKTIYAQRKETIERVFADAKEKHAMRYTHHRGLTAVTRWVRLKYAAMNLKKLANWSWKNSFFLRILLAFVSQYAGTFVFS